MMHTQISRRTMLRGLGTALALPLLDAMLPSLCLAGVGDAAKQAPRRLAFLYVPNGVHMQDWTPKKVGADFDLPPTLDVVKEFKNDIQVFSGLTVDKARPHGDGPGDHARAMSAFLTGRQPRKTSGADIRVGISVDQIAANHLGKATRFPSLELGCDRGLNAGNCDSGYSCAYSANLSWKSENMPMAKEVNPRLVFERFFANSFTDEASASKAKRDRYKLSVLDFVLEDATQLKNRLGANDTRKLEEYLSSVREIEVRLARVEQSTNPEAAKYPRPAGMPADYQEHMRLMADMMVLAFQTDMTRVSTFVLANEGSNRSYRFLDVPEGHHDLSHHGNDKQKQKKIATINRFHLSQYGYLLGRLKSVKEGTGNLLDNSMVLYGSAIGDGNRHNHDELPILLAGKGGGALKPGRHLTFPKDTPLTNLYLTMLEQAGVPEHSFGDSTGPLSLS
jgi:hypothetical protein